MLNIIQFFQICCMLTNFYINVMFRKIIPINIIGMMNCNMSLFWVIYINILYHVKYYDKIKKLMGKYNENIDDKMLIDFRVKNGNVKFISHVKDINELMNMLNNIHDFNMKIFSVGDIKKRLIVRKILLNNDNIHDCFRNIYITEEDIEKTTIQHILKLNNIKFNDNDRFRIYFYKGMKEINLEYKIGDIKNRFIDEINNFV